MQVGLFTVEGRRFYGGGFHFFGVQSLGVVSAIAWVVACMLIIFTLIKKTIGLCVAPEDDGCLS